MWIWDRTSGRKDALHAGGPRDGVGGAHEAAKAGERGKPGVPTRAHRAGTVGDVARVPVTADLAARGPGLSSFGQEVGPLCRGSVHAWFLRDCPNRAQVPVTSTVPFMSLGWREQR